MKWIKQIKQLMQIKQIDLLNPDPPAATFQLFPLLFCALVFTFIDAVLLWQGQAASIGASGVIAFIVNLSWVILLDFAKRFASWGANQVPENRRILRAAVFALVSLPVIIVVAIYLFRGTWISRQWWAAVGPWLVAPFLYALATLGVLVTDRLLKATTNRLARITINASLVIFVLLIFLLDRRLYPQQYLYLHLVLLLLLFIALWLLADQISTLFLRPRFQLTRRAYLNISMLIAGFFISAAMYSLASHKQRQMFFEHTHAAGRLVNLYQAVMDFDGDGYSTIFGERDCNNFRRGIHPLAKEISHNGIDEDCDGQDVDLFLAPPQVNAPLAGKKTSAWRQQPTVVDFLRRSTQFNIVVIVIDALRADYLPAVVKNSASSSKVDDLPLPNLRQLLSKSYCFTHAFSPGAGTDIGVSSIFSGRYDTFNSPKPSLLQIFREHGYATHGIYQTEVERWVTGHLDLKQLSSRRMLINDPEAKDLGTRATSKLVSDLGRKYLASLDGHQRFFLWLHYFDLHEHHQLTGPLLDNVERGRISYRRVLTDIDKQLGMFLTDFHHYDFAEQTLIVFLADHGEGLADRPRLPMHHGGVLYNPLVHVPLCFYGAGLEAGTNDVPVSLVDVAPTLLDLAGIKPPAMQGISLVSSFPISQMVSDELLVRPIYFYEGRQMAVLKWPYKLLQERQRDLLELYQLDKDFTERHNQIDELPEVATSLSRLLSNYSLPKVVRTYR